MDLPANRPALALIFCGVLFMGCSKSAPSTSADSAQDVSSDITEVAPSADVSPESLEPSGTQLAEFDDPAADQRPKNELHSGYVSSAACLECHPDEHQSWSHSYHRTMTQLVSRETVAGRFDGQTRNIFNWKFTPEMRGDEFWVKYEAADGSGVALEHPLRMITGSHHMQKYWYHTGQSRKMGMTPLVYLLEADLWLPEKSAFLSPPDQRLRLREGAWNTGCIQCHSTGGHPRISSSDDMDSLVAEFGISCEACHGPGERHVKEKTAESIVNPRTLPPKLGSQVCGQCHGGWVRTKDDGSRWTQTGNAYRPGDDLFETRYYPHKAEDRPLHAKMKAVESFWSDGENRVAGREMNGLVGSPCFQNAQQDAASGDSERRLTCISCHDLHSTVGDPGTWANDQLGPNMDGNQACLQCHESFAAPEHLVEHTHHQSGSSGSLCYNCHMPYTSYGLLKAVRAHTITSPSAKVSLEHNKVNACNQCHLDKTLAWTGENLSAWYGQDRVEMSQDYENIAASVLWSVKGDAVLRALMAWSMGWQEARNTSGEDWTVFYLVNLMFDDYDAIRYIAWRSLRRIEGFENIQFDHLHPEQQRQKVMNEVLQAWSQKTTQRPTDPKLLYTESGEIDFSTYRNLMQLRDNRPILLTE